MKVIKLMEKMMPKVQVLMSTYNGEKYLEQQIQSILNQDYANVSLLIRDDGSKDHTLQIIKAYAERDARISYIQGANLGVIKSFFELMNKADVTADYYALSDQDDVWKSNKIERAINQLNNHSNIPALYCSNTQLVNEQLVPISKSNKPLLTPSFGNALVENICSGCTCVFNLKLLTIIKNNEPDFTIMHDWWLYLCASAFGIVIHDREAYIMYRQHGNNVVGASHSYYEEIKKRLKYFKHHRGQLIKQAIAFDHKFQLGDENKKLLDMIINVRCNLKIRIGIVVGHQIYRQRIGDDIIFKILFALGMI